MALAALAAGILSNVDPATCLLRGLIAYVTGLFLTQLWYVFFTIRVQRGPMSIQGAETVARDRSL